MVNISVIIWNFSNMIVALKRSNQKLSKSYKVYVFYVMNKISKFQFVFKNWVLGDNLTNLTDISDFITECFARNENYQKWYFKKLISPWKTFYFVLFSLREPPKLTKLTNFMIFNIKMIMYKWLTAQKPIIVPKNY